MTKITLTLPSVGELDTLAEPKVATALKALEEFLNTGKIESTDNIKAEGIAEASLSSAIKSKLGGSFVGLAVEEKTANFEAESAKLYKVAKACTATLPAATSGRTIAVVNSTAAEAVKVSAKAGKKIVGDYFEGEVAELLAGQHLIVEADGSNWFTIAGEPKREQTYSALAAVTSAKEELASATRPVQVMVGTKSIPGATSICTVVVGGVTISTVATPSSPETEMSQTFIVPPNVKWKATLLNATAKYTYLVL